jgi:hypothetical protein
MKEGSAISGRDEVRVAIAGYASRGDFLVAAATGADPQPSFAAGLQVQRVPAAVETSAGDSGRWTPAT